MSKLEEVKYEIQQFFNMPFLKNENSENIDDKILLQDGYNEEIRDQFERVYKIIHVDNINKVFKYLLSMKSDYHTDMFDKTYHMFMFFKKKDEKYTFIKEIDIDFTNKNILLIDVVMKN
ncbi:hypothetical protein SBRV1_gp49 [Sulfolobales Beppu rod-shaped virus 1]|uniref:Uncharacterized protein n=1 Tax=Sulfolobales Beppu rod-shaped virus 1 TaxID=2493121 RepID=A0A3Q8Q7C3_9VIRU|nr:hypothetical protein QIT32_gp49 [Sulfolobales Beppu rod-shaped virus 1]AZI75938.1 hypothetical protein SBRV1_gp49 [Sulfolobales Beppu rod-shaped virus 1]